TAFTGNPCATNVLRGVKGKGLEALGLPPQCRMVLMVGGSRGAKALNEAMIEMAPLIERLPGIYFVFVTGEIYYESTSSRINQAMPEGSKRLKIVPYLHNMADVLKDAELVVGRSGASSL